jgi:hypothetical protein
MDAFIEAQLKTGVLLITHDSDGARPDLLHDYSTFMVYGE